FKTQMKLQIPSTIVGAIVGVVMAYSGYGVWSLVWLNLTQTIVFTIQNWGFIKWRPSLIFDKNIFKYHFNFGYKLTLSGLLDTIYNDAYRIVIGKFFSPTQVGFFNQAETMRLFPVQQIGSVMGKVTYPLFSNIEGDDKLRSAYKTTMKLVLFVVIPIMLILILVAKEGFVLLFGEKWLPAVPYFQILSIASIVRPISSYNLNILKIKGRSDLFLKVEVIKKIFGVIAIAVALPFGIMAMVVSLTVVSYIMVLTNMIASGRLINYKVLEQIKDISMLYILGILIGIGIYFLLPMFKTDTNFLNILSVTILFLAAYIGTLMLFEKALVKTALSLLKKQ